MHNWLLLFSFHLAYQPLTVIFYVLRLLCCDCTESGVTLEFTYEYFSPFIVHIIHIFFLTLSQVRYGRYDTSYCDHETADQGGNCTESVVALDRVRRACEGRASCNVQVRNSALDPDDPCPAVAKQAEVEWACRSEF